VTRRRDNHDRISVADATEKVDGSPARTVSSKSNLVFADRREAGRALATRLTAYHGREDLVVLALPRGGVPVAFEVAEALGAPLDIFVVCKLGMPGHREFAIGAIAFGGVRVLSEDAIRRYGIPDSQIEAVARAELAELQRREMVYRHGRALTDLERRTVILVDDGLATGSSMRAAGEGVRAHKPARVVVAVPVGAASACEELADITDDTVCARMPEPFSAVGLWYRDFSQTTDEEVRALLEQRAQHTQKRVSRARQEKPAPTASPDFRVAARLTDSSLAGRFRWTGTDRALSPETGGRCPTDRRAGCETRRDGRRGTRRTLRRSGLPGHTASSRPRDRAARPHGGIPGT
jgi:putative phosphoribosyl transferase